MQFVCKACGKSSETYSTSKKGMFCSKSCRADFERKGPEHPRRYRQNGYWMLCWTKPGGTKYRPKRGFQFEHVRVWQEANGPIPSGHCVHHKNGDGYDNRLKNLCIMRIGDHVAFHSRKYRSRAEQLAARARQAREYRARRKMAE